MQENRRFLAFSGAECFPEKLSGKHRGNKGPHREQRFSFASRRRDYDLLHERATVAAPSMATASKDRVMIAESASSKTRDQRGLGAD
jgi:hypothetical protein